MELVGVRARDCECPGTPHAEEGDIVFLLPRPSLACGLAAQVDIGLSIGKDGLVDAGVLKEHWLATFLRHGAVGWNLVSEDGKSVPFSLDDLLADFAFAYPVADKADDLYSDAILRPLLDRLSETSPTGPTNGSTSRRTQSPRKPRRSSSPATSAASVPSNG